MLPSEPGRAILSAMWGDVLGLSDRERSLHVTNGVFGRLKHLRDSQRGANTPFRINVEIAGVRRLGRLTLAP